MSAKTRTAMPSMAAIQQHWDNEWDQLVDLFPNVYVRSIGWGEPCCFRCGWLAPVKDTAWSRPESPEAFAKWNEPERWAKRTATAWNSAGGWLERCHLHDHAVGGDEHPSNLVPMCLGCHKYQRDCGTREDGIAYVNEDVWVPSAFQVITDDNFLHRGHGGGDNDPDRKSRRFWSAVSDYYQFSWRGQIEQLRLGVSPDIPSDPAYGWPWGPRFVEQLRTGIDHHFGGGEMAA